MKHATPAKAYHMDITAYFQVEGTLGSVGSTRARNAAAC
jgi:hypothetical protein